MSQHRDQRCLCNASCYDVLCVRRDAAVKCDRQVHVLQQLRGAAHASAHASSGMRSRFRAAAVMAASSLQTAGATISHLNVRRRCASFGCSNLCESRSLACTGSDSSSVSSRAHASSAIFMLASWHRQASLPTDVPILGMPASMGAMCSASAACCAAAAVWLVAKLLTRRVPARTQRCPACRGVLLGLQPQEGPPCCCRSGTPAVGRLAAAMRLLPADGGVPAVQSDITLQTTCLCVPGRFHCEESQAGRGV